MPKFHNACSHIDTHSEPPMVRPRMKIQPSSERSPASQAILQTFNASLPQDNRIIPLTLPLGDGLTLLLKK